jgi:putative oxidoreductase
MASERTLERQGLGNESHALESAIGKVVTVLGRILFAGIFVIAAPGHFKADTIAYAAAQGVPLAQFAVPLSGIIAIVGGLMIALGYKARWGAWLIALFLVPVTFSMHKFWGIADPQAAMVQQIMFMKNIALLGAALLITQVGSGPASLKE